MLLTRHEAHHGNGWAVGDYGLPHDLNLAVLLELDAEQVLDAAKALTTDHPSEGGLLPPLESTHEVWAAENTYERTAASKSSDIYERVYNAERPELFFKSLGWRVSGQGGTIRIRSDSHRNVPEPELVLVVNGHKEIVGYTAGIDMASRDIEGENPLYLPQARVYFHSCALGPGLVLANADELRDLPIEMKVMRGQKEIFRGQARSSTMKRRLEDLVAYVGKEMNFPHGMFLMTGAAIVPPDDFGVAPGDIVRVTVGTLTLENVVEA